MDINKYDIIITLATYEEINKIYDYITENLYAESAAKRLMKKIEQKIKELQYAPRIHIEVQMVDRLKRRYRKIVINNYIILYTIDEDNKIVFISHMYYSGRNYINNDLL